MQGTTDTTIFDSIRPYNNHEVEEAVKRLSSNELFLKALHYFFAEKSHQEILLLLKEIKTTTDFQEKIMYPSIGHIINNSSNGTTINGLEKLDPNASYLFISNHRDIFFDAAVLQYFLLKNNYPTTQISFGKNLMSSQLIIDFGKINKMYTVFRQGTPKEMYSHSERLSKYIRHTIKKEKESLWIAQRNGRTKDGKDNTQTGLLKMLSVSGDRKKIKENLQEINIVPVSISYELEPCDYLKSKELAFKLNNPIYIKSKDEDLNSIISGIIEHKGKIHLEIGDPINDFLETLNPKDTYNFKINSLKKEMDKRIINGYKCWKFNFVAADLMTEKNDFSHLYEKEDIVLFNEYMNKKLNKINENNSSTREIFTAIYGNPVLNKYADLEK